MNKNKFLFIAGIATVVIIVLIVIIVIININRNNSDDNGSNNSSNDNDIVLQYWGLWEPEDVMQPLIDEYEADNPGVTILYTQKSFTQYEQNAYTRLVEGATNDSPAPDILRINNSWLPKFQDYLYAMPSSVMSTDQYEEYFYPTAVDDFTGSDLQIGTLLKRSQSNLQKRILTAIFHNMEPESELREILSIPLISST